MTETVSATIHNCTAHNPDIKDYLQRICSVLGGVVYGVAYTNIRDNPFHSFICNQTDCKFHKPDAQTSGTRTT